MTEPPPPPPQVSPDGRFYWDGQRWVPMSGQIPPEPELVGTQGTSPAVPVSQGYASQQPAFVAQGIPAGYELRKQSHTGRNLAIGCFGLIAVIVVLAVIGSLNAPNTSSDNSSSASSADTTSPVASPSPVALKILLDKSGSGINKTAKFTAAGDWEIDWSYNCSNFGQQGNFQVFVYNGDGSLYDLPVNELGATGSDVTHEYDPGTYYLEMNSECNWHVTVKG